jgi:hypothetical protein
MVREAFCSCEAIIAKNPERSAAHESGGILWVEAMISQASGRSQMKKARRWLYRPGSWVLSLQTALEGDTLT